MSIEAESELFIVVASFLSEEMDKIGRMSDSNEIMYRITMNNK